MGKSVQKKIITHFCSALVSSGMHKVTRGGYGRSTLTELLFYIWSTFTLQEQCPYKSTVIASIQYKSATLMQLVFYVTS